MSTKHDTGLILQPQFQVFGIAIELFPEWNGVLEHGRVSFYVFLDLSVSGTEVFSHGGHTFSVGNVRVSHQKRDSGENENPGFFVLFHLFQQALEDGHKKASTEQKASVSLY